MTGQDKVCEVCERLKQRKQYKAKVLYEGIESGVEIEYKEWGETFCIEGLGPELPRFLNIKGKEEKVEASSDRKKWEEIKEKCGLPYKLFSPIYVLPKLERAWGLRVAGKYEIYGVYKAPDVLPFLKEYQEWGGERKVVLQINESTLEKMSQPDFPPLEDSTVDLLFEYPEEYLEVKEA